eukprot:scaffold36696_cov144-Skeletonema_dohrnii-CCMP3373.AAC.2
MEMSQSLHTFAADPLQSTMAGGTAATILCCICATPIAPNPSNTCPSCLASQSDVTRGISTEAQLHQCRGCSRWHQDAGKWIGCELESRELMALCLTNVSGLKKRKGEGDRVRLVDAAWVWTEPHSMRLKIRLTIQRELILKHGAHRGCLSIETFKDGMDFYFPDRGKAGRFISFLEDVVPMKVKASKKLIGTDDKSNVSNYKYTNLVEIAGVCKDDLLFLPKKLARSIGNINRLVLVKNISNVINVIDPITGQTGIIESDAYWRDPFRPVITAARTRLTRYVVLGKDAVFLERNHSKKAVGRKQRSKLATITAARESDLGMNDSQIEERSHLGYLLKSGDVCLGYDMKDCQLVDDEAEDLRTAGRMPDIVVVRKLYGGVAANEADAARKRLFKLQKLDIKKGEENERKGKKARKDVEMERADEEDFMQELEADKEMRTRVNVFKSEVVAATNTTEDNDGDAEEGEDEDDQKISLDELLDNLVLDAKPDADDEMVAAEESAIPGMMLVREGERAARDNITYIGRDEALNVQARDTAVVSSEWGKEFES